MIDLAHGIFRKSAPESGECRMIGRCIVKGKSQKLFKRSPVVDLGFQLRIGIDLEPLLQEQAFHKEKRRIGIVSFKAFTDGIVTHEQATTTLICSILLIARFFSIELKREISAKVKLVFMFLKPIVPPEGLI